jgi:hypothetical protein
MIVYLPGGREAAVELAGDPRRAVWVAGKEHERGVVSGFGTEVDLRHFWAPDRRV